MLEEVQKYVNRKEIISIYDDWDLDLKDSIYNQIEKLDEDLIQILFKKNYLLDVGWYPEHSINGSFKVVLIQYENWENPIYQVQTTDPYVVLDWITEIIELVFDFDLK